MKANPVGKAHYLKILKMGMPKQIIVVTFLLFAECLCLKSQVQSEVVYKQIGNNSLYMVLYHPFDMPEKAKLPAMIFFFGGGWETGNKSQFQYYALNYAKKGIITILVDYRISSVHGTTPFESLKDAKSAVRYLKKHADELQIDTTRLIASGGSAGGHLAVACFTNETINEDTDPLEFSSKPKVLVLFNPVVDNSINGYGFERLGDRWEEFSPMHNIRSPFPPTVFLLGTRDNLIPVSTGQEFKRQIENVGGRCDLLLYDGVGHGFFNLTENRDQVVLDVDIFLRSVGCLAEDERMTQAIVFPLIPTKYLNDKDFDPGAVASSGLPVNYSSSDTEVATIVNGRIHITGQGSAIIKAQQQGNEYYSPAPEISRILIVSSEANYKDEYWININFTQDSTLWKTALPPLATNGLSIQCSLNGNFLGNNMIGAFGRFSVSNFDYTPFNSENLNEKFIYSFRLSTNKTNQWILPYLPNIGKLKIHFINGSNVGNTYIPIQKNIADAGQSPVWVDFDPKIEINAPVHGFSNKSFTFEIVLNTDIPTQLRLAPSTNYNFCIFSVSISKNQSLQIDINKNSEVKFKICGRSLKIESENDQSFNALIFNSIGQLIGEYFSGDTVNFNQSGYYLIKTKIANNIKTHKVTIL